MLLPPSPARPHPGPANRARNLPGLLLLATVAASAEALAQDSPPPRSLFNGTDLTGWTAMHGGGWTVEDGAIVGRNGVSWSTDPEKSGSWLRSADEFGDFVFEFEYAINEGGNSGVFIRSALEKNPAFTGHEMQILDDHGREPRVWSTGALYDVVAATENPSKPAGEWNTVKIETDGPRVRVTHNGKLVIDHQSDRRTRGFLGLQNHDDQAVVRFRNLRVIEKGAGTTARPYGGRRHRIPGTIEAEHYDEGAAGVAYHDLDPENQGAPYRADTSADIEARSDASNGHGIGWTRQGEWLSYSVEVAESGRYDLEVPVASDKRGGTFHVEIDGNDVTGSLEVPDTGGWQKLQLLRHRGIELEAGQRTLRVVMDKDGPSGSIGDMDLFRFTKSGAQGP
jgi:hypothetical protein